MNEGVSSMVIQPKTHTWNSYVTSPTGEVSRYKAREFTHTIFCTDVEFYIDIVLLYNLIHICFYSISISTQYLK